MSPDTLENNIFLARQPILDRHLNLYAYELLFRQGSDVNQSDVGMINGDLATSHVINNTFLEFGIERVLGDKRGFINLTHAFLTGRIPLPFDKEAVVLEILEDITVDDEVIAAVQNLSDQGYTIALDDFIYHDDLKPLIDIADIIKIDLLALTDQELIEHVQLLKTYNVKLLAEKVETSAQYQHCMDLGFDYFQGYFFCKPTVIDDKPLPENKIASLKILSELQREDISTDEVESLIKQDLTLSFKLLRCINSAAFALPKRVESLRQAVLFLGTNTIKSWAAIIALANVESPSSQQVLYLALVRAKMAEKLASDFNCNNETAFMLGLFSLANVMFNKPLGTILQQLPLSEPIKIALQEGDGELGKLLMFIRTHERGSLTVMPASLSIAQINEAYLNATDWAQTSIELIK